MIYKNMYIKIAEEETDPLFIREFMLLLLSFIIMELYYNSMDSGILNFVSPLYLIFILLYSAIISSEFSNTIRNGNLGYLFTMPLKRFYYLFMKIFYSSVITALFFMAPVCILYAYIKLSFNIDILLYFYTILFISLLYYSSVGLLLGIIFRNMTGTFISLFFPFFFMSLYLYKLDLHFIIFKFLAGTLYSINYSSFNLYTILNIIPIISLSFIIIISSYKLLTKVNMRSGR